jgi:hypothetical protein
VTLTPALEAGSPSDRAVRRFRESRATRRGP